MQHSHKLKFSKAVVFTISTVIVHSALVTYIQAEAPPGESYAPPSQATEEAYHPPSREVVTTQSNHNSNFSWLGLIGLAGLAGLARHKST